jgi:thiamine biosynthesis protein ThiS
MRVRKTEVAVMVNGRVVRRASHANTKLNEGDSIEVVSYAGGG